MKRRSMIVLIFAATAVFAQSKSPNALHTWFADGTALEIHTESSRANSPLSTSGSVTVGAGNDVHRVVIDTKGSMLFAYDIEARRVSQGTFTIRIKPVDRTKVREESWFPKDKAAAGAVSTLAAARDFPPLRPGDEVQVDILYHPVTGEKIYDVVRVSTDPPPGTSSPRSQPEGNQFSFQEVRVDIDGQTIHKHKGWIIGQAMMVFLPGRGAFYLALSPSPNYPFKASGWVDHTILRFHAGDELVEIVSKSNVLQQADYGTIWVYHEPVPGASQAEVERLRQELARLQQTLKAQHPRVKRLQAQLEQASLDRQAAISRGVEFQSADDVELLIPKKRANED